MGREAADDQVRAGEHMAVPRDRTMSSGDEPRCSREGVRREVARCRHWSIRRPVAAERLRTHRSV